MLVIWSNEFHLGISLLVGSFFFEHRYTYMSTERVRIVIEHSNYLWEYDLFALAFSFLPLFIVSNILLYILL